MYSLRKILRSGYAGLSLPHSNSWLGDSPPAPCLPSIMNLGGGVLKTLAAPSQPDASCVQFSLMDHLGGLYACLDSSFPQVILFQWSLGPIKPHHGPTHDPD